MAARKTKAQQAPAVPTTATEPATLKSFHDGGGTHSGFRFQRSWWQGSGPRAGIAERILKKLQPGDDPDHGRALKHDVLLPANAPSEYMVIEHLLERYDATLPRFGQHAYAQITIDLDPAEPLHVSWERVRRYARSFADTGLAVVLVLHAPSLALSANAAHCHLILPARFLTAHGFGAVASRLCSDPGHCDAWEAWQTHLTGDGQATATGEAA
jgi:hypothetical protein